MTLTRPNPSKTGPMAIGATTLTCQPRPPHGPAASVSDPQAPTALLARRSALPQDSARSFVPKPSAPTPWPAGLDAYRMRIQMTQGCTAEGPAQTANDGDG